MGGSLSAADKAAEEKLRTTTNVSDSALLLASEGLSHVPPIIATYTQLKKLDLSMNEIHKIPRQIVALSHLEQLIVKNNKIEDLPSSFGLLSNLTSLNLSHNLLREIPDCLFSLPQLSYVDLSNNVISYLSPAISQLTQLHVLDLSFNQLKVIKGCLKFLRLTDLIFHSNGLVQVDGLNAPHLTRLSLSSNHLVELPDDFLSCPSLRCLELWDNSLQRIPSCVYRCSSLEYLMIERNEIKVFDEDIHHLQSLKHLIAAGNPINVLPTSFSLLSNLRTLNFQDTRFASLPDAFRSCVFLERVDFRGCPLVSLPPSLQESRSVLSSIPSKIVSNLYQGDASGAANREWLTNKKITHILCVAAECVCLFPGEFKYLHLNVYDSDTYYISNHFEQTNAFIDEGRREGKVLVHCMAGRSRSGAVVLAYLVRTKRLSFDEALKFAKARRPAINLNFGFAKQLQDYAYRNRSSSG